MHPPRPRRGRRRAAEATASVHAAQAGADGIELDVFLLKCGTLVVFHGTGTDQEPGRLESYCGVEGSILDYTAEEARGIFVRAVSAAVQAGNAKLLVSTYQKATASQFNL